MMTFRNSPGTFAWPVALALAVVPAVSAEPPPAKAPRFEQDVMPVLAARCLKCHGSAAKPKAGLDLRTKAGLLKGGQSGPALVPGSAEKSLLFQMVHKGEMPPQGNPKLTDAQVDLLRRWIDAGAPAADTAAAARATVTE